MRSCAIAFGALLLALAAAPACAPRPAPPSTPPAVPEPVEDAAGGVPDEEVAAPLPAVALSPLWETVPRPGEGFAGLAVWPGAGQRAWLVVAAEASHRLVLFDAESGELLREVGSLGERAGSFREPVAVAVGGDLAFVVERGNARVQVLRLPGLATVGFLGEGELRRPAAVAVEPAGEGWKVWVGEEGGEEGEAPSPIVHRFAVAAVAAVAVAAVGSAALDPPLGEAAPFDLPFAVARRLAGAVAYPCAAGGGWLEPSASGEVLALAGAEGNAVGARLAIEGADTVGAMTVTAAPAVAPAPGTLYVVTGDSRVVAVAADDLAATVAARICG